MSHRTAKFVSAIFASLLAGSPLVTASHSAPAEADKCLSGPKGRAARGRPLVLSHRPRHQAPVLVRRRREGKVCAGRAGNFAAGGQSASPPTSASTQSSIANARAELPSPQSRVEREPSVFTGQRIPATIAGTISPENDQRADAGDAGAPEICRRFALA